MNLILSLHTRFPTLKTKSIITSFFPTLLYRLRSEDPAILTAVSTKPHFHSLATWEGTSTEMNGMKPLVATVARCVDMVYTPLLEQLLWWMIGISAVLVHRAVIIREYVDM